MAPNTVTKGILGLALLVRVIVSAQPNLSIDEATSYYAGLLSASDLAAYVAHSDRVPPLGIIALWPSLCISSAEISLRLPFIISGVLACGLLLLLTRRCTGDQNSAWAAGLLYAVCFPCWEVDTQIRAFGLALLGSLGATWCCARMLLDDDWRPQIRLGWLIGILVSTYSFYFGGLTLVCHAVAYTVLLGWRRTPWLLGLTAAALLTPLLFLIHTQIAGGNKEPAVLSQTWEQLATMIPLLFGLVPAWRSLTHGDPESWAFLASSGTLTLLVMGWTLRTSLELRGKKRPEAIFLDIMLWGNLLGLLALCLGLQLFNLRGRYLVFTFPFILILVAHGLTKLPKVILGLLLTINLVVVGLWIADPYLHTSDMNRIARILKSQGSADDLLIVYLPSLYVCPLNYYYDRDAYRLVRYQDEIYSAEPPHAQGFMDQYYYRDRPELQGFLAQSGPYRRTWLLVNTYRSPDHDLILRSLADRCALEQVWEIPQGYTTFPEDTFQLFELKPKQ